MKSQFDPDVWAALLMILIVGFGGITFMSMFINGLAMHGILSIFDQEYNQRCEYFLLPVISNDYALMSEKPTKHFNNVSEYFSVNPARKETYFNDFMEKVNETIKKGYDLGENQTVTRVCWAMGDSSVVGKEIDDCTNGGKRIVMSCSAIVYGPTGIGLAEVVFLG